MNEPVHWWNEDTEGLYPDVDRDRRLASCRAGLIGGFSLDSLRREEQRRLLWLKQTGRTEEAEQLEKALAE